MPETIRDGRGKGALARVDGNNRLHIQSSTTTNSENANKDGVAYNINTGVITLTDDNETAILYLKNNSVDSIHIVAIAVGLAASTGGSGQPIVKIQRNPATGDIITNANNVDVNSNRNYGSANTLSNVNVYKGATGETVTNSGTDHLIIFQNTSSRLFATIDEVIPRGASAALTITPPGSNTSMQCYAAFICHIDDPEDAN